MRADLAPELFAGGTTALLVLPGDWPGELGAWRRLLEQAEALGFSGALGHTPDAVDSLRSLGVERVCVVAACGQAEAGLQVVIEQGADALVLLSPRVRYSADDLIRSVRVPRLLLVGSGKTEVDAVRRIDAESIGHVALRFFPTVATGHRMLESDVGHLVAESISLFAVRILGLRNTPVNPRYASALEEVMP